MPRGHPAPELYAALNYQERRVPHYRAAPRRPAPAPCVRTTPKEVRMPSSNLQPLDAARLHRGAEHLHRLGPRALAELLTELGSRIGGTAA